MRLLCVLLAFAVAGCAGPLPAGEETTEGDPDEAAGGVHGGSDAQASDAGGETPADPDAGGPEQQANGSSSGGDDTGSDPPSEATSGDSDSTDSRDTNSTSGNNDNTADSSDTNSTSGNNDNTADSSDANGTEPSGNQTGSNDPHGNTTDNGTTEPETRWLDVSVFDDTTDPLAAPGDVEIEVVGTEAWHPDLGYGAAGPHAMGEHEVGKLHVEGFIVRMGGQAEGWCEADLEVTAEMDNEADADVTVVVYNVDVRIYGPAVPGHPDLDTAHVCIR